MTETILLVIFAVVTLLLVWLARQLVARRQLMPFSTRVELAIRLALCVLFAVIARALYGAGRVDGLHFWLGAAANALVVYAVTHIADRLLVWR
jgi:type VI protein secretion system component VasK